MYANVLVEYPTKKLDKCFVYIVPTELKKNIRVGMKVKVPFNTKDINGFVLSLSDNYNGKYSLKEISSLVDEEIVLNEELLELGKYISKETMCPLITAYQAMLPQSLKIKENNTNYNFYKTYIILNKDKEEIINYLKEYNKINKQSELLNRLLKEDKILKKEISYSLIKSLKEKNLIKEEKEQTYRINKSINSEVIKYKLNEYQNYAYQVISKTNNYKIFLLEGVTGSGKTEVYLNLINNVLRQGKSAILLLPEITLTMQIINKFYDWFGSQVSILHSQLSNGEKHDEYLKIIKGETSVVVGTRSAAFAPLKNLGLIIIDEEHSESYKQENTPKYHAIDVCKKRCEMANIPLVLGSATPTLEDRARAIKGLYSHLFLKKRVGENKLPKVLIVNMREEVKKNNFYYSDLLINKIKERISRNEQAIILLNRRGYSPNITCSFCGYTFKCPNCSITLTYHKNTLSLNCHYCGYTKHIDNACPNCGSEALNFLGIGTEKAEYELKRLINDAKIIRMDQDTTLKKGSHEKIINSFKNGEYDILLGTQMISKGLDFPKVSLVGILNADSSFNIPDFRSNEKSFALLYQTSGRAGRNGTNGEVIIQTYNPNNYILKCVENNDFNSFFKYEMEMRHTLKYPPYYYLVLIRISSKNSNESFKMSLKTMNYLKNHISKDSYLLGPSKCSLFKINNIYRYQIIIKYRYDDLLKRTLKELDEIFLNIKNINFDVDFNPLNL